MTIKLVDALGDPLEMRAVAVLQEPGSGTQYKALDHRRGIVAPFGYYQLRIEAAGFEAASETISIFQPNVELRVGLQVAEGHTYQHPRLDGTVRSAERIPNGLWVKLSSFYNGGLYQASVGRKGQFAIVGAPPGMYVLCVFQGNELLHCEPVKVLGKRQIDVTLPTRP
ncbi:MAG: hypothetical protein U0Q16_26350 [Bryobacteraceae bacterium]